MNFFVYALWIALGISLSHPTHADERGTELAKALNGQFFLVKEFRPAEGAPGATAAAALQDIFDCGIAIAPTFDLGVFAPDCLTLHRDFLGSPDRQGDGHYHFRQALFRNRGRSGIGIDIVVHGSSRASRIEIVEVLLGELPVREGYLTFADFSPEISIPGRKIVMPDRQLAFALDAIDRPPNTPHDMPHDMPSDTPSDMRRHLVLAQTVSLRDRQGQHRRGLQEWAVSRAGTYAPVAAELQYAFLTWLEKLELPTESAKGIARVFLSRHPEALQALDRPRLTSPQILTHVLATLGIAPAGIVDSGSAIFLVEQLKAMTVAQKLAVVFSPSASQELRYVFFDRGGWHQLKADVSPEHVSYLVEQLRESPHGRLHALDLLEAIFSREFEVSALRPLIGTLCDTQDGETLARTWDLLAQKGGAAFLSAHQEEIATALRGCSSRDVARAEGLERLKQVKEPWVNDLYLEFVLDDPYNFLEGYRPRHPWTGEQIRRVISSLLHHGHTLKRSTALALLTSDHLVPTEERATVTEALKARARIETEPFLRQRLLEEIGRRVTF